MVKADLGTKRVCPSCAARFYDLQKRPIECPKCAFSFEPEAMYKQRRPRQPEAVAVQPASAESEDEETENEEEEGEEAESEEVVEPIPDEAPIQVAATGEDEEEEEAAEETETEGAGMSVVDEDDIEDIVVEDEEDEEAEDNSLLEEDEDENDDVSGIIDADIEKDERWTRSRLPGGPTPGLVRGHSSAGRAPAWHAGGQRFDPAWLHQSSVTLRTNRPCDAVGIGRVVDLVLHRLVESLS